MEQKPSRHNRKRLEKTGKVSLTLPVSKCKVISKVASSRTVSQTELVEDWMRKGIVSEKDFKQVMFELSMTLSQLIDCCMEEKLKEASNG